MLRHRYNLSGNVRHNLFFNVEKFSSLPRSCGFRREVMSGSNRLKRYGVSSLRLDYGNAFALFRDPDCAVPLCALPRWGGVGKSTPVFLRFPLGDRCRQKGIAAIPRAPLRSLFTRAVDASVFDV